MYKYSFSLENRKENAVLASVYFIIFENVIKNFIPIFGNQLWTVALMYITTLCGISLFLTMNLSNVLFKIIIYVITNRKQRVMFYCRINLAKNALF